MENHDAYFQIPVNDNVLILDVTMSHAYRVKIVDGIDDLGENMASLVLRETLVIRLFDALKKIMGWSARELRWSRCLGLVL